MRCEEARCGLGLGRERAGGRARRAGQSLKRQQSWPTCAGAIPIDSAGEELGRGSGRVEEVVKKLGARGIEAQRPEMAGLDDGGGLLGLVARRKKGSEKGDRPGSRMDPGQVDKVGSIWRAGSPGGRRVVVVVGLPVAAGVGSR